MREASWDDCIETFSVIKVSPDKERAKSLIETSNKRIEMIKDINENNCNFVFEDYYSSLLELLQAMVVLKGYKVTNRICLGYYLKDIMKKEDLFLIFDDIRYKRNSLMYYGKMMDFETAKQTIEKCEKLIEQIKKVLRL